MATRKKRTATKKPKIIKLGKQKIKIKNPGVTSAACKRMGYKSGCDPRCLSKLEKRGGVWTKRAALAKGLCKIQKKKRKSK